MGRQGGNRGRGGGGRGRGLGGVGGKGGGRGRGPRLDSRLLRQLDDGRKAKDEEEEEVLMVKDFYEYEEGVAEEETGKNKRYDSVEHVEYELPSDFEVLLCLIHFRS